MNLTRLTKNPAIATARADIQQSEPASPSSTLGDYVIFVDDSGDACLDPIDPRFPMLNLVFCIIKRTITSTTSYPTSEDSKRNFLAIPT